METTDEHNPVPAVEALKKRRRRRRQRGPSMEDRFIAWWKKNQVPIAIWVLIIAFFFVYFWQSLFFSVYSGEAGVLWSRFFGGTQHKRYDEGYFLVAPWNKFYIYNVRIQEIRGDVSLLTSNGLLINVRYSARFFPHKETLSYLHQNVGPDYIEKIVRPEVVSALRRVFGNYTPEEIYAKDEHGLLDEIMREASENINSNFISFHDILVLELLLPDKLQAAINDKLSKEQMALAYEHILKKEAEERKRRVIEAQGIREFTEISQVDIMKWRGIEATEELARSNNAKIILVGTESSTLPVLLSADPVQTTGAGGVNLADTPKKKGLTPSQEMLAKTMKPLGDRGNINPPDDYDESEMPGGTGSNAGPASTRATNATADSGGQNLLGPSPTAIFPPLFENSTVTSAPAATTPPEARNNAPDARNTQQHARDTAPPARTTPDEARGTRTVSPPPDAKQRR